MRTAAEPRSISGGLPPATDPVFVLVVVSSGPDAVSIGLVANDFNEGLDAPKDVGVGGDWLDWLPCMRRSRSRAPKEAKEAPARAGIGTEERDADEDGASDKEAAD